MFGLGYLAGTNTIAGRSFSIAAATVSRTVGHLQIDVGCWQTSHVGSQKYIHKF